MVSKDIKPEKKIWGMITIGTNCIIWNSLLENIDTNEPIDTAVRAITIIIKKAYKIEPSKGTPKMYLA